MKGSSFFILLFLALAAVIKAQNATTPEPVFRSIKISFDALETLGGKNLWKIWLNIPTSEQECIQGAVKNEIRNYLSGIQTAIVSLPVMNQTCPTSFPQFKKLYQLLKKKATAASARAKAKLPKSVIAALAKVYATFAIYRSKQELKNDTQKFAVLEMLLTEMNKIPAADMVKVGNVYPQLANVVQGDGAQNLKAVINDYAKKFQGQETDPTGATHRLQTLMDAMKDGYVKSQTK